MIREPTSNNSLLNTLKVVFAQVASRFAAGGQEAFQPACVHRTMSIPSQVPRNALHVTYSNWLYGGLRMRRFNQEIRSRYGVADR